MPHLSHPKLRGIKSVEIRVIAQKDQRYLTIGDWVYDVESQHLKIFVTRTGDWREEMTVATHELIEALLCIQSGVSPEDVDEFDQHFEATRDLQDESEPGDDLKAPYYLAHQVATSCEHILATHLGLHWPTYSENLGPASCSSSR